jgi:hypothetical protein
VSNPHGITNQDIVTFCQQFPKESAQRSREIMLKSTVDMIRRTEGVGDCNPVEACIVAGSYLEGYVDDYPELAPIIAELSIATARLALFRAGYELMVETTTTNPNTTLSVEEL